MILPALLFLLAAGYIGINFVGLPPLLVVENIILAVFYAAVGVVLLRRPSIRLYVALALVAVFNAGRVSRTIWSPVEGFGKLAVEHVPLFLYLLLVAALAIRKAVKAESARR